MNMKRLFLFLVLLNTRCCSSDQINQKDCSPSSCGNILNISYPFRLKSDPQGCGEYMYELSCENNFTLLYLSEAKFYVKAINYHNHTIRVVDPGIDEDDCSSMPRFPLSYLNLSQPVGSNIYVAFRIWPRDVLMPVKLIKCVEPVNSITDFGESSYFDASSCIQRLDTDSGVVYRYAYVGLMDGQDLKEGCNIEAKTLKHSVEDYIWGLPFVEIHRQMAFGFELFCQNYYCSTTCSSRKCDVDTITGDPVCTDLVGM
ncbi:hypothetical protein M5689_022288 [Euphorbia peplus]|nr:hypothetical protein M5689_022288 [Euphorbia peplus]